jgi:endogenous inhibitor of DNA gyrase (YacG/DUF329 family)
MSKKVKCPTCTKLSQYAPENPYRPFCSERCKLIDLGEWADGKYALASTEHLSEEDLDKVESELSKKLH